MRVALRCTAQNARKRARKLGVPKELALQVLRGLITKEVALAGAEEPTQPRTQKGEKGKAELKKLKSPQTLPRAVLHWCKTPSPSNFEPRLGTIGIVIVHEDGGILTGKLRGKNHMQLLMAQGGEGVRPLGALALVAGPSY